MSSLFKDAKNASARALSQQSPRLPSFGAASDGHRKGVFAGLGAHVIGHAPPNDPARASWTAAR